MLLPHLAGTSDAHFLCSVCCADATPLWDKIVGTPLASNAIVVYPQSTGNPTQRQFWNTIFWQCSVGVCVDKSVDDVGFLSQLTGSLPSKFGVPSKRVFMTGTSAGTGIVWRVCGNVACA